MIQRLIRKLWGTQPKPVEQTPEKAEKPEKAHPQVQDEVELPVEPGYHYTRDLNHHGSPKFPKLEATSLEHVWAADSFAEQMYKDLRRVESKVLNERIRDREIERFIEEDQTSADFDRREGHVVLPESNFEYHGDRASVRYPPSPGAGERDGSRYTLQSPQGLLQYDLETRDLSYFPSTESQAEKSRDFSNHTTLLSSGTFRVGEGAEVEIPSAQSLEQAELIAEKRELALEVKDLLSRIEPLKELNRYRLDQGEQDHDPRPGRIVADKVEDYFYRKDAALTQDPQSTFSVESSNDHLKIYEDSSRRQAPRLLIESSTANGVVTAQKILGQGERSLHIEWNKSAGEVQAELRQDAGYKPPEPEKQRSFRGATTWTSSPSPRTESNPRDEGLPDGFSVSRRAVGHGDGRPLMMIKSPTGNPHDYNYPETFVDEKTGDRYGKTTYTRGEADGLARMYIKQS